MNDGNAKYLENGFFYLGFGMVHGEELRQYLNAGTGQFSIDHPTQFYGKDVSYRIDLKRSAKSQWINISGFLITPGDAPEKQQYFGIYKNRGFTAKEAFNLVEGRAVCKDHVKIEVRYQAWHVIDFSRQNKKGNFEIKSYHEAYGFDVAKGLAALP